MTRGASLAYDRAHGEVMAFGGIQYRPCDPCGQTWIWDGLTWRQRFPQNSPPGRFQTGLAYDSARGVAVIFGGWDGEQYLNDTWLWDGENWTAVHPPVSPSPRAGPILVYDEARQAVVLFGGTKSEGRANITFFADTWTWDGQSWTEQPPSGELSNGAIPQPKMAYDAKHEQVVLWQYVTGTWIWDGRAWTNHHPESGPDLFYEGVLAYNEAREQIVLWGASQSTQPPIFETWAWDGAAWTQLADHNNPGPTSLYVPDAALLYHPPSQRLLLFAAVSESKEKGFEQSIWAWGEGWELLSGPAFVQATETARAVSRLPAQPSPTPQTTVSLDSFHWVDAQIGWGVGIPKDRLYRTADGGLSWRDVTPGGAAQNACQMFYSLFFLDETTARVVGEDCASSAGVFHRTQDGGETWESFPAPFTIAVLHFTDELNGRAAADRGCIDDTCMVEFYITQDGGQTWKPLLVRTPYSAEGQPARTIRVSEEGRFSFEGASTIWLAGIDDPAAGVAILWASRDNGQIWQKQELPLPEGDKIIDAPVFTQPPLFLNQQEGFFYSVYTLARESGEEDRGVRSLFTTQDGGQTWTLRPALVDVSYWADNIDFVSMREAFAFGPDGLMTTHDGGETWQTIPSSLSTDPQGSSSLAAFDFVDPLIGYAILVEQDYVLYKTADGGLTWQKLPAAIVP